MAMTNIEKRVIAIEQEVKSLKAIESISGTLVKMCCQTSQGFSVGGSGRYQTVRIRFRPDKGRNQVNLINLTAYGYYQGTLDCYGAYMEPQDGSGDVIIRIPMVFTGSTVFVVMTGPSPGTFSRI